MPLAVLPPRKEPPSPIGWEVLRALGRPDRSQSLYRLRYPGSRSFPCLIIKALNGGEWQLYFEERGPGTNEEEAAERSKFSAPAGKQTPAIQPVASRYTD
jgi:hypothetical protein